MPYNPSIPAATHTPAQDQPDMQLNFAQIASSYNTDHQSLQAGGLYHNKSTYPAQTSDPVAVVNSAILYSKDVATIAQLFYRNSAGIFQLTSGTPVAAATGQSSLPGGIILKWGIQAGNATQSVPVSFATAFTNAFVASLTPKFGTAPGGTISTIPFSIDGLAPGGFTAKFNSAFLATFSFYWVAIGN